jgi:hypothetical protein
MFVHNYMSLFSVLFCHCIICNFLRGLSWSSSYGTWIYNYLCNQCLSSLTLCVQARCTIIQHYVIKFVSDLRQVGGFLRVLRFPLDTNIGNKTDRHDITEILLNVALSSIPSSFSTYTRFVFSSISYSKKSFLFNILIMLNH